MLNLLKNFFIRLIKFSIIMGIINFIMGYIKPYMELLIYHVMVGPEILLGRFLHPATIHFIEFMVGMELLYQFIMAVKKYF